MVISVLVAVSIYKLFQQVWRNKNLTIELFHALLNFFCQFSQFIPKDRRRKGEAFFGKTK